MGSKLVLKPRAALSACLAFAALVLLTVGCGGDSNDRPAPTTSPTRTPAPAPTGTPTPSPAAACVSPSASPSAAISAIDFTPSNPVIDNPASPDSIGAPATITVKLTPHDDHGNPLNPKPGNPLQVEIFGAPDGAISPTSKPLTSGTSFTFAYSGQYLPNDLLLEAWIADPDGTPTLGQYSIGTTLILRKNRQSPSNCSYQMSSFAVGTDCTPATLPGNCTNMTASAGIQIQAAIGASPGTFHRYTVDTGSLGVLVPQSQVPAVNLTPGETQVVGPAGPGVKYYDSNGGHTFHGQYWLAPVTFLLSDGTTTVSTHPIKILVLPNADPLYYMGIGFDRNSTKRGDYFNSPADNAFLNVTDGLAHGSDVSPGYTITPNLITLGVTMQGFQTTALSANQCVPGDYAGAAGCFSFQAPPASFCGTMLMDTGIGDMYLNLRRNARPAGLNQCTGGKNCVVPEMTVVQINSGKSTVAPPMCYQFVTDATNSPPISPEPSSVNWSTSASDPTMKFVNTGRHPLAWFTYLYDSACGQIGFLPNSEYEQTCN